MQPTRRTNNTILTPKVTAKKRAGSLSAEKLAQAQQQLFYEDLSYNSSPSSCHLKTLLSPESLPSTEATFQNCNSQYYGSQNRSRIDSKLLGVDHVSKDHTKVSPIPYNAPYNEGPESHGIIPSRSSKVSKGNQLANALDIEVMMPSEAKKLCEDLEQLNSNERKVALVVDENTFSAKIQQEIDCVGCVSSLHTYLYELSELARNKPGNVLHFEGFVVYGDRSIGLSEEKIGDIQNIAYILHHHKSKNSIIDELTRSLNIKKKHDGHGNRGKVLSRCLLHSKKPMPNGIWREALQNLIEHDINEVASVAELDETVFISSLQMHTKRRKFCATCRENIMYVYENMLEEASNCSDCEEGAEDDEEDEEEEEYEDNGEEGTLEEPEIGVKVSGIKSEELQRTGSNGALTSDYGSVAEANDSEDHHEMERHSESGKMMSYSRKSVGTLLACIKYCPERRKIAIPLEMEIFMEFLSKAENSTTVHTKHANTKEAAQEELVACIGTCLKERLQSIWRAKKSDELARILFMKLAADCVVDGIGRSIEEKNYRLGHKTILEEYLKETEAAEQQKKEKMRQKRQKRKEKKKGGKQSTQFAETSEIDPNNEDDDNEKECEPETDHQNTLKPETNEAISLRTGAKGVNVAGPDQPGSKGSIKDHGGSGDQTNIKDPKDKKIKEEPPGRKKDDKKSKKNAASSPLNDKVSTDSNTPETKKTAEKNPTIKKGKKETDEEEKLEKKKKNAELPNNGNVRNNRFSATDERERSLLLAMGWSEEISENEANVDEKDVRKIKDKWSEIEASRADFRKSAKEKFMRLMYSKKNIDV